MNGGPNCCANATASGMEACNFERFKFMSTVLSDRVFEVKNVMLLVQSCEYCPAFVDHQAKSKVWRERTSAHLSHAAPRTALPGGAKFRRSLERHSRAEVNRSTSLLREHALFKLQASRMVQPLAVHSYIDMFLRLGQVSSAFGYSD